MAAPHQGLWSKSSLFHRMRPEQVARLGELLRLKRLDLEEVLFREGDDCHGFYVVLEGAVQLRRSGEDGRETVLNVVRSGQSFAEAAVFSGGAFPATAVALEPSLLAHFPKAPFLRLLRDEPDLCLGALESLASWHHRLTFQVQQLSQEDGAGRLRRWLSDQARESRDGVVRLRVPKKVLAAQLGMAPETLSRLLRGLRERGEILEEGREIRLRP
ncbi:MAG TPA: Crp/Fnr family transcriptional regulator [Holophagaceae bacterium]|nr:Crp/Fnr family transcriptional regulator [Holophagaceae bacterium]